MGREKNWAVGLLTVALWVDIDFMEGGPVCI